MRKDDRVAFALEREQILGDINTEIYAGGNHSLISDEPAGSQIAPERDKRVSSRA
jgi:hypothetical protein